MKTEVIYKIVCTDENDVTSMYLIRAQSFKDAKKCIPDGMVIHKRTKR